MSVKQFGDRLYVDCVKTLQRCEYQKQLAENKQLDEFAKTV